MYLTSLASGGAPAPKSGRLDPSDPEYQRIQRDAASAFGDEPAAAGSPSAPATAPDLGDQVAALMAASRGKVPAERSDAPASPATSAEQSKSDLADDIVAIMAASRGKSFTGASQ